MSAGASSYSTRPWVRDSDASSICSAGSSGWSGNNGEEGSHWIDEGGEVYKVGAERTECELDFTRFTSSLALDVHCTRSLTIRSVI
jgi:hypothetical protein